MNKTWRAVDASAVNEGREEVSEKDNKGEHKQRNQSPKGAVEKQVNRVEVGVKVTRGWVEATARGSVGC